MTTANTTLQSTGDWLGQALASPLSVRCIVIGLVCIVVLTLGLIVLARLGKRLRANRQSLLRADSGTAMMEFTLVLPILLAMGLLLAQTTMVMAGNIYVHYAAFSATRAAVVFVGADMTDEGGAEAGVVDNDKEESIRRAAVVALLPAAGRSGGGSSQGSIAEGLHEHFDYYNRSSPNWIDSHADARLAYADANTEITLYHTIVRDWNWVEFVEYRSDEKFGPKDPITVRVSHKLALNVPIARHVFGGDYTVVDAQYTLTNEGVPTPLPPTPTIPRVP